MKPLGGNISKLDARNTSREVEILQRSNRQARRFCIDHEQTNIRIAFGGDHNEVGDVGIRHEHLGAVEMPSSVALYGYCDDIASVEEPALSTTATAPIALPSASGASHFALSSSELLSLSAPAASTEENRNGPGIAA